MTGMVEHLKDGKVLSKRMIADFTTELSAGLEIWKRDAAGADEREKKQGVYHQGSYFLPLSMKFPSSERLYVHVSTSEKSSSRH